MEQNLPAGRNDKAFIKSNGKRKAFHKGSNSSCRFHIRQHYDTYKERCETADIPVNHWAIPWPIWNAMEAAKDAEQQGRSTKKEMQQQLDFQKMMGPREFTRAGVLHAVAMLIATNNQVSCQYRTVWSWWPTYSPSHLLITSRFIIPWLRWDLSWPWMTFQHPTMSRYTFIMSL